MTRTDLAAIPTRSIWIVLALTVVGALLRLGGLEIQSLWYDELCTWRDANLNAVAEVWDVMRIDRHPPGYEILMYYWRNAFGVSETALRMPSAIAGILSIPAIYFLGRALYGDDEGLIAATLLTFAWTSVRYSQEARAYALLVLVAIVTTWLLLRLTRELAERGPPSWSSATAFVVLAAAACYLHYFGAVLVFFQAATFAVAHWNRRAALLWGLGMFAAIGVLYAPWLAETLQDLQARTFWAPPLKSVPAEFNHVFSFLLDGTAGGIIGYVAIGYLLLRSAASWRTKLVPWYRNPTLFLIAWIVVPFGLAYVKSMVSAPLMVPRYFLISLPAVYLLVARAVTELIADGSRRLLAAGIAGAACLLNLVFGVGYYSTVSKEQFREALGEVVAHERDFPGAALVVWNGQGGPRALRLFDYYLRQHYGSGHAYNAVVGRREDAVRLINAVDRVRPPFFWYVYAHKDPDPDFLRALGSRYQVVRSSTFYRAGAILFGTGYPPKPG